MDTTTSKVVYIICDQGVEPDVLDLMKASGHDHYTSWTDCQGSGETGVRQGTAIWPGLNTVLLIVMQAEQVMPLVEKLHELRDSFPTTPGLKVIVTDGVIL